jgi:FKBP-type peptidyl-prolyl cis-trans isomerase
MKKHLIVAAFATVLAVACTKKSEQPVAEPAANTSATTTTTTTTASTSEPKVEINDSVVGKGAEAVNGKAVTVHYTGTLKDGTKRKLTIPADLAYGNNAVGAIPANSTLIFEVELLEVK